MADEKQQLDWDKIKKFSKQVSNDIGAAMLGALSYIGDRLGIFSALAEAGAVTSTQLAEKTGLSERYLREWLGAMTAAGYVNYDVAAKTYAMPAEHAMVLARDDSPFFAGGFIEMIVPQMSIAPKVMASFKDGRGVSQSEYPPETWEAMERSSASMYRHSLIRKWLPAMPQVVAKLTEGGFGAGRWLWERTRGDRDRVSISQGQGFRLRRACRLAGTRACKREDRRPRRQNQV